VFFVFSRDVLPSINGHKATGWAVLRAEGYSLMFVGAFVIALASF
jgi:hypothetical protein